MLCILLYLYNDSRVIDDSKRRVKVHAKATNYYELSH